MDQLNSREKEYKQEPQFESREEADFYLEDGIVVFTEKYLLKRGICCHCGCRHCPYVKKNQERKSSRQ